MEKKGEAEVTGAEGKGGNRRNNSKIRKTKKMQHKQLRLFTFFAHPYSPCILHVSKSLPPPPAMEGGELTGTIPRVPALF